MKKYFELFRVTVEQYFVYRLNFALWRFRVILNLILIYSLWSAIYLNQRTIVGYSQTQMLTYVLLISFLSDLVLSSKIHELGAEILTGDIINRLLKPWNFFGYLLTKELADKVINISFAAIEITVLIVLLKPHIVQPPGMLALIVMLIHVAIGIAISFFLSFCISLFAFWSAEIWAPRFIYFILVFVLAGNYFPLDILPEPFYNALLFTPFPYFIFIPAQIYIKGLENYTILSLIIGSIWVVIAYLFSKWLWKKGVKQYSFYGR
jgi:ABC-2 type transport system permease protein